MNTTLSVILGIFILINAIAFIANILEGIRLRRLEFYIDMAFRSYAETLDKPEPKKDEDIKKNSRRKKVNE